MKIPIFPLSIVIYPNSQYPLHIFEERYKKMVNKCSDEASGFGIVSKIKDEISQIGVFVEIKSISKPYGSGEFDIVVKGSWRFTRLDLEIHPDGYFMSEVKKYDDRLTKFDIDLFIELKSKVKEILTQVNYNLNPNFWEKLENSNLKSFKIAEKSGLTLVQQQELLTIKEENKRMHYLIDHFEKLTEKLEKNMAMRKIILGDGYLN
ncbi:MAG: LON peptidase substrate-binding domain-containing protein [Ignavibacteria bacterium]|nr:LON peptidase substrate-binding domain-containing protein [Ignavibacteria bacterium]MBT8383636.1 LON peptidase substrate-binding domain-containing protein [Ignavibacteria bacterium]MBT8393164.1 LON peptidase substrate-binding domain-containing protein [Ignavibacteria bacterium]NNJ53773.1 LON peptidase substrate-binding domain-containing protein [Ignavibacteriaceae bacterium]NNL21280.1 LON peptidase substrate-binding domain-containing protein [Ignavibacteriaceae bacterium]